ncbi:AEC family transporter [Bisgaard Taxon 46]
MSLSILAPLIYLLFGIVIARFPVNIKGKISAFLTRFVIPFVIVFNIATSQNGLVIIMLGMICVLSVMLLISTIFKSDPVKRLCFFYLNIAWLGLPVASAIWGSTAATILIAIYIGSSLFCNSVCASLMASDFSWKQRILLIVKAPPVIALGIGVLLLPWGNWIEQHIHFLYELAKFTMTFFGMMLLGIWLSSTKLKTEDFKQALLLFLFRFVSLSILITLCIWIAKYYEFELVTQNQPIFYLVALLPPAANLIILETYYLNTGKSASMIACGTIISMVAIGCYISYLFIF